MKQINEHKKYFLKKEGTHSDDVGMVQPEKQGNLRGELLLQQNSQILVLLGLTSNLNSDISLLINSSVNPTVPPRCKLVPDEQLRHVGAPFLLTVTLYLRARRHQILGPRNCPLVLPKGEPPPGPRIVRDMLEKLDILHELGLDGGRTIKIGTFTPSVRPTLVQSPRETRPARSKESEIFSTRSMSPHVPLHLVIFKINSLKMPKYKGQE